MEPISFAFIITALSVRGIELHGREFYIPQGESSGPEPAHIHAMHKQRGIKCKIWIGCNEQLPIGSQERYMFQFEDNHGISGRDRKYIIKSLTELFATRRDIREFYENVWQGGWYNNIG